MMFKAQRLSHGLAVGTSLVAATIFLTIGLISIAYPQQPQRPNILVIFGDDIGIPQVSAYTMGMMGYRTPNIDRIAQEGAIFTDSYGQQSCTAGRASFIRDRDAGRGQDRTASSASRSASTSATHLHDAGATRQSGRH